jgi:hypothetical protein
LKAPLLVWAMAIAFLLLVASLLIGSFSKPEFPLYEMGLHADSSYTLDASRGDEWKWWGELGFRRNHVITAPGAATLDLGPVSFDSTKEVPAEGYVATIFGADTVNPAIGKWYSYSMWSHLLTSNRHVYAVRTADRRFVLFEILAYYCREVGSACYTVRYKTARPRISRTGGAPMN